MSLVVAAASLCIAPRVASPQQPTKNVPQPTAPAHDGAIDGAILQGLNGVLIGGWVCETSNHCWDEQLLTSFAAGAAIGGVTGYFVGSYFKRADVMMFNTGTLVGAITGGVVAELEIERRLAAGEWGFSRDALRLRHLVIGEVLGGAAMAGLSAALQPTTGRVSLANSGGWWSLFMMGLGELSRGRSPSPVGAGAVFALGFGGGWMLWDELPLARSDTWKLDLGGALGAIGGAIWATQANEETVAGLAKAMTVGSIVGLATGGWLVSRTHSAQAASAAMTFSAQPQPGGAILRVHGLF